MRQNFVKIKNLVFFATFFIVVVFAFPVFASSTDGTIDSVYKYAWSENIGWINFGASNGNVHVTDSALTGYAWNENYGWINLSSTTFGVKNNGNGNLSGSAWSEGLGWINFSGVTINNSGEFLGYAAIAIDNSKISFNCANTASCGASDFKVKTDWRPASSRGGSGEGGGLPIEAFNPPTAPEGGFKILINNDIAETNSKKVTLTLKGGSNTAVVWISENSQFPEGFQLPYNPSFPQAIVSFILSDNEGVKIVYAKFCTRWGQCSKPEIVFDSIIYKEEKLITEFLPSKAEQLVEKSKNPFIEKASEILKPLVPEFLKSKPQEIKLPEVPIETEKDSGRIGVHTDTKLKTEYRWLEIVDWKIILLILIIILLLLFLRIIKIKIDKPNKKY